MANKWSLQWQLQWKSNGSLGGNSGSSGGDEGIFMKKECTNSGSCSGDQNNNDAGANIWESPSESIGS